MTGKRGELPVAGEAAARPRRDAERNRQRVLQAARALIAERPISAVSMDEVAAAAGVGKGTVYRQVGDRAGLARALLDERDRVLQEAVLFGPPPLGPGGPAVERLPAFLDALVDATEENLELLVEASLQVDGRYTRGPYPFWNLHLRVLLGEVDPDLDTVYLADALLAPLGPRLYRYQRRHLGLEPPRIKAGLRALLQGVMGSVPACAAQPPTRSTPRAGGSARGVR